MVEALRALGRAIEGGANEDEVAAAWPAPLRPAVVDAVRAIRTFEARVGRASGLAAEIVSTPSGPAIEVGNRDHVAFGAEHEEAAAVVARCLLPVLEGLGATGAFWFTMD